MLSLSNTLDTLLSLQRALDVAQDTDYFAGTTTSTGIHPAVNIFEKSGDLVLVAELPGIKKEQVQIQVKGDTLRLTGERILDYGNDVSYHRLERSSTKFDRTLKLPFNIEADRVKADYKDGLLVVTLPRAESDKPKRIQIQ